MRVDINSDMGESFGIYRLGNDGKMMEFITSANIACGWHAGDATVMAETVRMAQEKGVGIGAHPGYPDLLGFGRRNMETFKGEIKNYILYQVGALAAFARAAGGSLQHVKPHGALYNLAARDERAAGEVIAAVKAYDPDLILVTLAGSLCAEMADSSGLRVVKEFFPDRAYLGSGNLAPRTMEGSVIDDVTKVKERVLKLVSTGKVTSIDGLEISLDAGTLCFHGDTPGAWELAKTVRESVEAEGIRVLPMSAP
ncbi:MAG: LamB/YcsF family protein [Desulfobacteraceae bacterium]|nr:LamB/YcsF family protein [Desulfobacteraceae bacterium]